MNTHRVLAAIGVSRWLVPTDYLIPTHGDLCWARSAVRKGCSSAAAERP